ncbi:MAG: transcription/translation regulatory transformer protein RfaH [Chloroflexota bacterium]|nr:transcription/translation regulatory transformer protein RfaH [Chloroflexota bacterium]
MARRIMADLWVVLRTQPRRELLAARSVAARGVEAYVPRLPSRHPERWPLVFPGYLFARLEPDSDDLLRIRSVPGIAYVLPRGGPPTYLPESVIQLLRRREAEPPRPLQRGERVVVMAGPFSSLEAIFDRHVNAAGRVRVLLELVHRVVPMDLHDTQLRRASGSSL